MEQQLQSEYAHMRESHSMAAYSPEDLRLRFKLLPRSVHSILPTPLHALPSLSTRTGCNLWCKRDDLTGFAMGGNKTRKLDFLISEAVQAGADTLVAVGANQSNFCRIATGMGRVHGMDVHLVLGGGEPEQATGNLLLDHLLGATCHHVSSHAWADWEQQASDLEAELVTSGRKVFRMPIGGSTRVGALGYVRAFLEILEDLERHNLEVSTIVHTTASGGTQAGLTVGQAITGWPGRIIGMSVAKTAGVFAPEVESLAKEVLEYLEVDCSLRPVIVEDAYLGDGYAKYTAGGDEAVRIFGQECGILLDRVYTGKAAAGLLDYCARGEFTSDENILFIHTGGVPQLFA